MFGLDSNSYVTYEDQNELERQFRGIASLILKLNPKDVRKFRISRQTLWNIKQKRKLEKNDKISIKLKIVLQKALSSIN